MQASEQRTFESRQSGGNLWIRSQCGGGLSTEPVGAYNFEIFKDEEAVGPAMFNELVAYAGEKDGDVVMVLLGGRGAQAMYRIIARLSEGGEIDDLLARL